MKIGIVGCAGRMGRMLVQTVVAQEGAELSGGTEHAGSDALGKDPGTVAGCDATGLAIGEDAKALFVASDVVIDFTSPMATVFHAGLAQETGTALVVGTTGMGSDEMAQLSDAAQSTCIVQAGNMSVGVNLLTSLVEQVSATLGTEYDIEVVEMHHRHKVDAPSGTALMLGEAAAAGRDVALSDVACMAREGQVGARPSGEIGFATLRGGGVIGEHAVIFASEGERIELTHKAGDRSLFADGAVRAAIWTNDRAPGLYSMKQVLGLA